MSSFKKNVEPGESSSVNATLRSAAYEFYIYAIPLIEVARTRDHRRKNLIFNRFTHDRALSDHTSRLFTTPNNDTLYSYAFIDLRQGPVKINIPRTGTRYFSLALMDMYSNNLAYAGTRVTGGESTTVTLVGPDDEAAGEDVIKAPAQWVWALARTLVDGEAGLPEAFAVQDELSIEGPLGESPSALAPPENCGAIEELVGAMELMVESPPPPEDSELIERLSSAGIDLEWIQQSPDRLNALQEGFSEAKKYLSKPAKPRTPEPQWIYPKQNLGSFGVDYGYRAKIAIAGLFALEPVEAMYMRYMDGTDAKPLDGRSTWRVHFDKPIPVNSFWSLSMYEPESDGSLFFADNPLRRYAIGDRTKGLAYNSDGSLDIWIGHSAKASVPATNWLPAPEGPFVLILRAYLPKDELLEKHYQLPKVEWIE